MVCCPDTPSVGDRHLPSVLLLGLQSMLGLLVRCHCCVSEAVSEGEGVVAMSLYLEQNHSLTLSYASELFDLLDFMQCWLGRHIIEVSTTTIMGSLSYPSKTT
jgi:hypothetical protein